MGFGTLEANAKECLLLEYIRIDRKERGYLRYDLQDFQIAKGIDDVKKYFKDSFGEEGEIPDILERVDDKMMWEILSQAGKSGEHATATLYFCDTGRGGGVTEAHSRSKKFEFYPEKKVDL